MFIIPEAQSATALDMATALQTVRAAYLACDRGEMYPGGRIAMPLALEGTAGQWLTAVCTEQPYFGFKFSAVFPQNTAHQLPCDQSTISLFSNVTGAQLALIGANHLTALKTGASAGVATDLLARQDACRLGIIGTGIQAFTQVMAVQSVRHLQELRVFDLSAERAHAFIEKVRAVQNHPYDIIFCSDANQCVAASDIICTVTPSRKPVFDGAALQAGTHVNAIGSFTPTMQELPEEAVQKAALIVTEHVDGLWAAAGDILIPYEKGLISKDKVIGSVADLLAGNKCGRTEDAQITLYESVGSCVLDVAIAIAVYQQAVAGKLPA